MKPMKSLIVLALMILGMSIRLTQASEKIPETKKPQVQPALKNYNVSVNTLILFGFYDVGFDVGVTENMTAGFYSSHSGSFMFLRNSVNNNISSWTGIGGRLNFYLNHKRFTNGFYLSPFSQVILIAKSGDTGLFSYSGDPVFSLGTIFGYQWVYDNGFNIMLGAGLNYYHSRDLLPLSHSGLWPACELRLGYTY